MGPRSSQNPAKIDEKSMKDGLPNQSKFCMLFEWPFSGSWKPTWPEKLPKRVAGGDATLLPFSGLEGSWGGLGASWGPRADFNRFLVDF